MTPASKNHRVAAIYKITNLINGKIYVGSSVNLYIRYSSYKQFDRDDIKDCRPIEYAIKKYGFKNFVFDVLEYVEDRRKTIEREQYWLDKLMPWNMGIGYNIQKIADSPFGLKRQDAVRYKLAKAVLQIDMETLEIIQEFRSLRDASQNFGGNSTGISAVCKRRRNAIYGFYWCFKNDYQKGGFTPREDHRVGAASSYLKTTPINQFNMDGEFVRKWISAKEIREKLGFRPGCIYRVCHGTRKHSYGYVWKFNENDSEIKEARSALKKEYDERFTDAHNSQDEHHQSIP